MCDCVCVRVHVRTLMSVCVHVYACAGLCVCVCVCELLSETYGIQLSQFPIRTHTKTFMLIASSCSFGMGPD